MIINTNQITLESPSITMDTTYISAFVSDITNDKPTGFTTNSQIGFFQNETDVFAKEKRLNVVGFPLVKQRIIFDVNVHLIGGHYVIDVYDFDVKIKEHLLKCFPEWDADKLQITTEPIIE